MTDYYLAILGPDGPERRLLVTLAEQADAIQTLVNDDTKVVLAGPDQPHLMLPSRHGIILGRLFARERLSQPISRLIEEDEWASPTVCRRPICFGTMRTAPPKA